MDGGETSCFNPLLNDTAIGSHSLKALRVGLDYVKADETLPAVA